MKFLKFYRDYHCFESFKLIKRGGLGSNPGGMYKKEETGEDYYIKFPQIDSDQAHVEVLSSKILTLMGVENLDPEVVEIDVESSFFSPFNKGESKKVGVATKWIPSLRPVTNRDLDRLTEDQANDIAKIFSHAILVKNWDVVGNGVDYGQGNIYMVGNQIYAGDTGGSFYFRAQGRRKDYTPDVSEFQSLLDSDRNYESSRFLTKVFTKYPNSLGVAKKTVQNIDSGKLKQLFDSTDLDDSGELYSIFKRRMSLYLEQIDGVAKQFQ